MQLRLSFVPLISNLLFTFMSFLCICCVILYHHCVTLHHLYMFCIGSLRSLQCVHFAPRLIQDNDISHNSTAGFHSLPKISISHIPFGISIPGSPIAFAASPLPSIHPSIQRSQRSESCAPAGGTSAKWAWLAASLPIRFAPLAAPSLSYPPPTVPGYPCLNMRFVCCKWD